MASARTARARSGPVCRARHTVVAAHIEAVVAESGDHLGRAVDRRRSPQRLEPAVDPARRRCAPGRQRRRCRPVWRPGSDARARRVVMARRWPGPSARSARPDGPAAPPAHAAPPRAPDGSAQHHGRLSGRRRRRGRTSRNRQKLHSGEVRGRKSSFWQARSMADQTATAFCRCPRSACSDGSAVMVVGSLRWSSLTCDRPPAEDLLAQQRVDVDPDQLRLLEAGPGARPVL